jgi:GDPmannose 4,6-dehydratase
VRDEAGIIEVLKRYEPREIYNFAAYASGTRMHEDPVSMGDVNGLAVARLLEAVRQVDVNMRFCQASSSEMFGDPEVSPQSEDTSFRPRSPYGAAKLYAHWMVNIYRKRHGLFACSAILFNHESERRSLEFVSRKVTNAAARIKLGLQHELRLGNLSAQRDWGYAGDYVHGMWLMLQHGTAADYVLATGTTHSVRTLCEYAFSHLGLDYREYVREDQSEVRPPERVQLVGDYTRAAKELNWQPTITFREMIIKMVESDLRTLHNGQSA